VRGAVGAEQAAVAVQEEVEGCRMHNVAARGGVCVGWGGVGVSAWQCSGSAVAAHLPQQAGAQTRAGACRGRATQAAVPHAKCVLP
jgi:hypothetical protein